MALSFPRDLALDFYLGRWVEVTSLATTRSLRQVEPVTVVWGSPNEQARALAPPSTAEGVLNNTGGHWTPGNPMSDYYDYLMGRNVPSRLYLRTIVDTFNRTRPSDWLGTTDTGDVWQSASSGSTSESIGSGVGTHVVSTAGGFLVNYVADRYADGTAAITSAWNMNVAGAALEPCNLVLRYNSSGTFAGEHYLLRVSVSAAEVLTVAIFHSTLGLISTSTVTVATLTPGANTYRAKFQAEGQTLRGKVYPAGPSNDPDQFEPLGWQVQAHHERLVDGYPGIRTGVAVGNTNVPVTVTYDNFVYSLAQHVGEVTSLAPSWDVTHKIKKARLKMADVTQRLGNPKRPPMATAPARYCLGVGNTEFTATDFWPLDEASTTVTQGNSATGGIPASVFAGPFVGGIIGSFAWGRSDQAFPAAPSFLTMSNNAVLNMSTRQGSLGSATSIAMALKVSPNTQLDLLIVNSNGKYVDFIINKDGSFGIYGQPSNTSLGSGQLYPAGTDRYWITLGICLYNNGGGGNGGIVYVNGAQLGTFTWSSDGAYLPITSLGVDVSAPVGGTGTDLSVSSIVVTGTRLDTALAVGSGTVGTKLTSALRGWIGETAGARAQRLATEEGVPFDYWGDLTATRPMGPQRPAAFMDQMTECAEADQGLLYGSRYTPGVTFRTRLSMCARAADATVDYSLGMVAPDFSMSADDRPSANLVTASRVNGGSVVVEQTSGPMNTQDPGLDPYAIGKSPGNAMVNVQADTQLRDVAGWVKGLGTVPELRFPKVVANLRAPDMNTAGGLTATRQLLALHPGDRLVVTKLSAADIYRDLDQIVRGGKYVFRHVRAHQVEFNTAPYEVYRTAVLNDSAARLDSDTSKLNGAISAAPATLSVASVGVLWTVDPTQFPLDIIVGRQGGTGQRMTISNITGAASPQTFTVSNASVNGVSRTWPDQTEVHVANPVYLA